MSNSIEKRLITLFLIVALLGPLAVLYIWFFLINPNDSIFRAKQILDRLHSQIAQKSGHQVREILHKERFVFYDPPMRERPKTIVLHMPVATLMHPKRILTVLISFDEHDRESNFVVSGPADL